MLSFFLAALISVSSSKSEAEVTPTPSKIVIAQTSDADASSAGDDAVKAYFEGKYTETAVRIYKAQQSFNSTSKIDFNLSGSVHRAVQDFNVKLLNHGAQAHAEVGNGNATSNRTSPTLIIVVRDGKPNLNNRNQH